MSGFLSSAGHDSVKSAPDYHPRRHRRGDGSIEFRGSLNGRWGGYLSSQDGDAVLVRFVGGPHREAERLAEYRRILENCLFVVTEEDDSDPERPGRRMLRISRDRSHGTGEDDEPRHPAR